MSDEFALQRDVSRSAKAKALLDSELLTEAFKTLEDGYYKAWRETSRQDTSGREQLFLAANVIGKVKEHLITIVSGGTIAQAELNKLNADAERKKRFGII